MMAKPPRVHPLTPAGLRGFSDEHLYYEVTTFFADGQILAGLAAPTVLREHAIEMALIESFVIHLRNIVDFFYADRPQADDVIADDFFEDAGTWQELRPELASILDRARERANREIAHLTTKRIAGGPPNKAWDIEGLFERVRVLLKLFSTTASRERLGEKAREVVAGLAEGLLDLDAPVLET
jgi:hypothetical protein